MVLHSFMTLFCAWILMTMTKHNTIHGKCCNRVATKNISAQHLNCQRNGVEALSSIRSHLLTEPNPVMIPVKNL